MIRTLRVAIAAACAGLLTACAPSASFVPTACSQSPGSQACQIERMMNAGM
ncbi:hypothetical protein QTH87_18760 [Variovorax sp. J22P168]|uniref:hypothetical protein n=1 Tax=Variovorax jilinensis TaxID=3053513 RepID=UPI002575CCB1|nr:hypothetical protein [Variovorax sp. J22P168]MDM0014490.1 hypothetical protein [Variovorax sp. J22P168]